MVLPITAEVNQQGHLEIGGCDPVELAREHGTPLFILDEETIRSQCRLYLRAFRELSPKAEIIYAGKAVLSLKMCEIVAEEGLFLDVSSGGELYLAHKAGFPRQKIFFHGNNKTPDELRLALDVGIGRAVVDSENELFLLNQLAKEKRKKAGILLRITPGVVPTTHSYIQTGQEDSKFGFGLARGVALNGVKKAMSYSNLHLKGIHFHIGSQIFVLGSYAKAIDVLMNFVKEIKDETGFEAEEVNAGGGLGIKYRASDEPSSILEYAQVIVGGVRKAVGEFNLSFPKIMIEPGRSIVGNAGVTLYTIGTMKEIPGVRTYASVDGGMSDNLRPLLYGAVYEALLANRAKDEATSKVTIAGKHCESGDILIKEALLPHPETGDILCTPATGAYGYVMANNYNKQRRPPVILVKEGEAKVIVGRETYDELFGLERA